MFKILNFDNSLNIVPEFNIIAFTANKIFIGNLLNWGSNSAILLIKLTFFWSNFFKKSAKRLKKSD